jgi:hypothetical protein
VSACDGVVARATPPERQGQAGGPGDQSLDHVFPFWILVLLQGNQAPRLGGRSSYETGDENGANAQFGPEFDRPIRQRWLKLNKDKLTYPDNVRGGGN